MNFEILFREVSPIPSHALIALLAIVIGGIQFALPKGTFLHRWTGYLWVSAMIYVSVSAFFIYEIRLFLGLFSPIHLLPFVVFASLWISIRAARSGNIARHRLFMIQLYVLALIVTGGFTLLPGRTMHQVIFGM